MANLQDLRDHLGLYYLAVNPNYKWVKYQQLQVIPHLEAVERGEIRRLAIFMPPGHAKALALPTPIPTPSGWTTMGELRVGSKIFSDLGESCNVTAVSEIWRDRPVYSVETDDGDVIIADENHLWPVRLCRKRPVVKLKTTKYLAERKSNRAATLYAASPLKLQKRKLPVDPYVLGCWLGDGRTQSSHLCSADDEIIEELVRLEGTYNLYSVKGQTKHFRIGPNFHDPWVRQADTLQGRLRFLSVLNNKHIPIQYLRASIEQRLSLLQGLIDTDGSVSPDGQIAFTSIRRQLADGVRELVASLGGKASISERRAILNGKDCGAYYWVSFYLKDAARLSRKRSKTRTSLRGNRHYLRVTPAGRSDTVCIEVDSPSHQFLCGRTMLPTHNSDLSTRTFLPWYLGRHPTENVMVCSYSADLASDDFGAKIKARMSSDLHKDIFPSSAITHDSSSKTHFTTVSGGSFYSVGFQGGITGKRLDIICMDDLIKSRIEAESDAVQTELFDTYRSTIKDRLKPGGRLIICMHRWLVNDIAGRILEMDGLVEDGGAWTVLSLPAESPPDSGNFLWEDFYGQKSYEDFKKDDETWASKFQQDPMSATGYKFREEWLNFYDIPMSPGRFKAYMFCDPASSKNKRSDFTVINIFLVGQDRKLFLADWVWDKLDPGERMETIMRMCRRWQPERFYYESYGLNADHYHIQEKMAQDNFPSSAYPTVVGRSGKGHNLAKHSRIDSLIPFYREGKIFLPRKFERRRFDGTTVDYTKLFVDKEYRLYRGEKSIPHDDNLDCQSRLADADVHIDYDVSHETTERDTRMPSAAGASWYSTY